MDKKQVFTDDELIKRLAEIEEKSQYDKMCKHKVREYRQRQKEIEELQKALKLESRALQDSIRGATNRRFSDHLVVRGVLDSEDRKKLSKSI